MSEQDGMDDWAAAMAEQAEKARVFLHNTFDKVTII